MHWRLLHYAMTVEYESYRHCHSTAGMLAGSALSGASSFFFGAISIRNLNRASAFRFKSFMNLSFCLSKSERAPDTYSSSSLTRIMEVFTCGVGILSLRLFRCLIIHPQVQVELPTVHIIQTDFVGVRFICVLAVRFQPYE